MEPEKIKKVPKVPKVTVVEKEPKEPKKVKKVLKPVEKEVLGENKPVKVPKERTLEEIQAMKDRMALVRAKKTQKVKPS